MPTILIINKLGSVKELNVKQFEETELFKKAGFKNGDGFQRHHQWDVELKGEKMSISIYGKTAGRAGQENKYEMPPPIDNTLFFGSLVLVGMNPEDEAVSLDATKWEKIYEALYGGFEDIGSSEEENSEEEDEDEELPKTKSGYAKDGFIVDDEDDDETDFDDEEDDDDAEEEDKFSTPVKTSKKKPSSRMAVCNLKTKSVFETIDTSVEKDNTNDGELTEEEYV